MLTKTAWGDSSTSVRQLREFRATTLEEKGLLAYAVWWVVRRARVVSAAKRKSGVVRGWTGIIFIEMGMEVLLNKE